MTELPAWWRRNLEQHHAHQRAWRKRHPEAVAAYNEKRRRDPVTLTCVECGVEFEGRPNRIVCSKRCRNARYRRLHPEVIAEQERRKAERRRAKRVSAAQEHEDDDERKCEV